MFTTKKSKRKSKKHRKHGTQDIQIFEFFESHIDKNNISQDDSIIFLVFVEAFLVIIRRSPGPDFDKIFEVPGII